MLSAVLFFSFYLWNGVMPIPLPEYINRCSRNDPELNECALKAARASINRFALGEPERGLKPLDPLYVEEMIVYIPNENGLKLVFKDNLFHGLADLDMKGLRFDLKKKLIVADAMVNLDVHNTYELNGKFLVVPISSNGDSSIKLKNTLLHIRFWYEDIELDDDGRIHWNITKHDIKYEVEKAIFRLDNLLGDKNIGDQINRLLNELWQEIVNDVGPTISHALLEAVVENLKILLSQVSFDEMMPV